MGVGAHSAKKKLHNSQTSHPIRVGILVSRILDIFVGNSGHFQMVAVKLSMECLKRIQKYHKLYMSRIQAYVYNYVQHCDKIHQIHDSDIFLSINLFTILYSVIHLYCYHQSGCITADLWDCLLLQCRDRYPLKSYTDWLFLATWI